MSGDRTAEPASALSPASSARRIGHRTPLSLLLGLFFVSGAAALVYEVLWLKELSRLFGATAQAASATLAVFFLGLAAGGAVWGRRAARLRRPLITYALLELAIAASAASYFVLIGLYRLLFSPLATLVGDRPGVFLAVKLLLALVVLGPPAFFMGGTLPVMAQYLAPRREQLGRRVTVLYLVNTLGAACGVLAAGFWLPPTFGFRRAYLLAMAANVCVACAAAWLARRDAGPSEPPPPRSPASVSWPKGALGHPLLLALAALSGGLALALEVLWTRMLAQVLQNSVYTFAAVLAVFLLALSAGAGLAHLLARRSWSPDLVLLALLLGSGLLVAATPRLFVHLTRGLEPLGAGLGWGSYLVAVFALATASLGLPAAVLGTVFPYLMKAAQAVSAGSGRTVGRLTAVNTGAGVVGSLAAGFALLPTIGLWRAIAAVATAYLLASVGLLARRTPTGAAAATVALVALAGLLFPARPLASVELDSAAGEELVALYEGAHGTVTVVRRGEDLRARLNNSYLLGTSLSAPNTRLQAHLALALHPNPRRVFFLGLGTGISAGATLDYPLERLDVCELDADIVRASRTHFSPWLNGLFSDPRARVRVEDGRTWLATTRDRYDVVVGDIFLTYRAGVGALYTVEHFATVRSRLAPRGIFVQWLTLFDMTDEELATIVRSMREVFPQVTLWRRGFSPRYPVFALVATAEPLPLDPTVLTRQLDGLVARGALGDDVWLPNLPLAAYAGNIGAATSLWAGQPLNTDDRTVIEYTAPVTEREAKGARRLRSLAYDSLGDYLGLLLDLVPPSEDPFLSRVAPAARGLVVAGLAKQRAEALRALGRSPAAMEEERRFRDLVAEAAAPPGGAGGSVDAAAP